jgi:PBP1b-binding outer membrane lipoprotein LpoB
MKKFLFVLIAATALILASCGPKKTAPVTPAADTTAVATEVVDTVTVQQ